MQQFKRILVLFTGMSLLLAGILGIAIVFDFAPLSDARELFIRLVVVFAIVTAVSGGLLLLSNLNKD